FKGTQSFSAAGARPLRDSLSGARIVHTTSIWVVKKERLWIRPELIARMLDHSFGEDARAPQVLWVSGLEPLLGGDHQEPRRRVCARSKSRPVVRDLWRAAPKDKRSR